MWCANGVRKMRDFLVPERVKRDLNELGDSLGLCPLALSAKLAQTGSNNSGDRS